MGSNEDHNNSKRCFLQWMELQKLDVQELLQSQNQQDQNQSQEDQTLLVDQSRKGIQHYQDYTDKRIQLAKKDISPYFAPKWNSSIENSVLWLGGCRPTIFIRLLYALCGSQIESQLTQYLRGVRTGNLGELSCDQINMVDQLHRKTISEEDKLTSLFASLQEEVADQPLSLICKAQEGIGEPSEEVDRSLHNHDQSMIRALVEADNLRINTLKEVISILTPLQAVDFLVSGKKLHLCLHKWGQDRDHIHGRD